MRDDRLLRRKMGLTKWDHFWEGFDAVILGLFGLIFAAIVVLAILVALGIGLFDGGGIPDYSP
jgi:hypothetical protein